MATTPDTYEDAQRAIREKHEAQNTKVTQILEIAAQRDRRVGQSFAVAIRQAGPSNHNQTADDYQNGTHA